MLRGFATMTLYAADLDAARAWYADLLGVEAYYSVPGYAEFRVGDYQHELGIIDAAYAPHPVGPTGVVTYWHVDDVEAAYQRLLDHGATALEGPTERGNGSGFVTATTVDPFGNILGVMCNPHYVEVLGRSKR